MYGRLGPQLKTLPAPLGKIIGQRVQFDKAQLRNYLASAHVNEADLGGSLDDPLSTGQLNDSTEAPARYFLIHDTSSPYYADAPIPSNVNESDWEGNDFQKLWANLRVAHVFVNRTGQSITTVDFKSPVTKGFGTKFARDRLKERAKGLQLHVELIQPRRRDPAGSAKNDAIAPVPGFTEAQLDRLALTYMAASVRRGEWLIPAFHAAMDAGILDAHDDPQNFDLNLWAKRLDALIKVVQAAPKTAK